MDNLGYIYLDKKIMDWEWYTDTNTFKLFVHMIMKANWTDKKWRGILIERGSFISSYEKLSIETGLTVQEVRTSINHLLSTNEVTKCSTSKYTLFKVSNYNQYQCANKQINKQITNNQQTTNKQLTTTNKKERKIKEKINNIYGNRSIVQTWDEPEENMSEEERQKLIKEIEEMQ